MSPLGHSVLTFDTVLIPCPSLPPYCSQDTMFYGRSLEKLTRVASRNGRVLQRRWESTAVRPPPPLPPATKISRACVMASTALLFFLQSQDFGVYPGDKTVPYVTKFEIIKPTTESMPGFFESALVAPG
jgi:hypothetical protein